MTKMLYSETEENFLCLNDFDTDLWFNSFEFLHYKIILHLCNFPFWHTGQVFSTDGETVVVLWDLLSQAH